MQARNHPAAAHAAGSPPFATAVAAACWLVLCCAPGAPAEVVINEFLADNKDGLRTKAGAAADWIELANTGATAADVGGWWLTDKPGVPQQWRIPDGTTIAAGGHLVVFADSSPVAVVDGELHANFSLSKDGEYLALFQPDGTTVASRFAPYPPQLQDVSYGRGPLQERQLVGPGTALRYRVPNAAGTAPWTAASGALGFSSGTGTFTTRYYEISRWAARSIDDVDEAETMISDSRYWRTDRPYPLVGSYETIDFHGTEASGYFTGNVLFPGHSQPGEDRSRFILVAEGAISVPSAGQWTFAVGSDDGFRLRISGHGVNFVSEFHGVRSFATTLATFNFPAAGVYDLRLLYFENSGGASLELSAAPGFQESFSLQQFSLAGDPAGDILHAGAIGALVDTDVSATMKNVNTRLDAEWQFTLAEQPAAGDTLTLRMRCADGFSAALNGTPLATLNTPSPLGWNSTATATRTPEQAMQWLSYTLPASALASGSNTLAVVALNNAVSDPDFLVAPQLGWRPSASVPAFFRDPTPGAANAEACTAPTPVVTASEPRGYKTGSFSVALACPDPAAEIRYTTDGSVPGAGSTRYTGPFTVSRTTTLRAAVVDPLSVRQNVTTVSWLFLNDILQQGSSPPAGWPANRAVNNHVMEYGLRQEIVNGDSARLRAGITNAIPSVSLVTDLANLFNAQSGIYVNPNNDGIAWERPVSVEVIDPVRGPGCEFHIDAGLRIRGAYSRSSGNPKHSFRLIFRSAYGEGKLRFPLFEDEGAAEFDKVDLRTSQNYSWAFENSTQETFVRETFSRDSQRDMGMPYTRSRYYHLYLNGQYWGLYQTQERGDADFAETYLGGDEDDWDCIKTSHPNYTITANDGNFDAYHALHNIALNQGFAGAYSNNYYRVRGLNPDGTPNPAYPVYLDEDNLIVYMLIAYYTGDPDSPVSIWGGFPNNIYALHDRAAPSGFKWLRHDAEHSLGAHGSYQVGCDTTTAGSGFNTSDKFNPATLHQRLCLHPNYRLRFADLAQKHLYGDGALTTARSQQRFRSRMNEIDLAIIGESARWGRGKTRDATWLPTCNAVINSYLAQRRDIIIGHFRTRGWFPGINAPAYSVMNTTVVPGHLLRVTGAGTFYYTTDGSDPRLPNGAVNPAAVPAASSADILVTGDVTIKARALSGSVWSALAENALAIERPPMDYARLRVSELMYAPPAPAAGSPYTADDFAWLELRNTGLAPLDLGGVRFASGITHTFAPLVLAPGARLVLAKNPAAFATRHPADGVTVVAWTDGNLARSGETLALADPEGNNILTFTYSRLWHPETYTTGRALVAVDLTAAEPLWSTAGNWRAGHAAGTPGLPEPPLVAGVHVTPDRQLVMETAGLEGCAAELWFSLDLATWAPCDAAAWSQAGGVFTVDLTHPSLPAGELPYFQVRVVDAPPPDYAALRVSELMYAPPAPAAGSPFAAEDFAWLELHNTGNQPLDLEGVRFVAGITHTFAPLVLAPGARMVLAKNPAAFATRHPADGITVVAWDDGTLARTGETLALVEPGGDTILAFAYSSKWFPATLDTGRALVPLDPAAPLPLWSTAGNWRAGTVPLGTPGLPEPPLVTGVHVTPGRQLVMETTGLEGPVALWFSQDLGAWAPCDPAAWSETGGVFTVDLHHPSLPPAADHGFFQLRSAN